MSYIVYPPPFSLLPLLAKKDEALESLKVLLDAELSKGDNFQERIVSLTETEERLRERLDKEQGNIEELREMLREKEMEITNSEKRENELKEELSLTSNYKGRAIRQ